MIYVSDPALFARRMGRRTRRLGDIFAGNASSCTNSDGTIDNDCVAAQSVNEGKNLVNYQDSIDSQEYSNCEASLALNNQQRQGLGLTLLPDTCSAQFPANANVTVYTGYGNVTSGSGSPSGGTYYGQGTPSAAPIVYNPAAAYPVTAVLQASPVAPLTITQGSNPPLAQGSAGLPSGTAGVSAGGVATSVQASSGFSLDSIPDWAWLAAAAAAVFLVVRR